MREISREKMETRKQGEIPLYRSIYKGDFPYGNFEGNHPKNSHQPQEEIMVTEISISITPQQLAEIFWNEYDSIQHAEFFSHLATLFEDYEDVHHQMDMTAGHEEMTQEGLEVMVLIGKSAKEVL